MFSSSFSLLSVLLGLLVAASPVQAQQVRADVTVDSVTVGERFTLTLTARYADSLDAQFPDPAQGDTLLGDLVVIDRTDVTSEMGNDGHVKRARYEVTTFAIDTAYVPPLPVRLAGSRDTTLVLSSMLAVPVQSVVTPDASDIRELAPLATFPRPWWFWVLAALAPLVLIALGYLWWRRQQTQEDKPSAQPPPQPPVPPYESAQRRLRKLKETTDWDNPEARKPFYVELADVARTYLKRRLDVAALESTTRELLSLLEAHVKRGRLPQNAHDQLRHILEKADQVKFANRRPTAATSKELLKATEETLSDIEERQRQREQSSPETQPTGSNSANDPAD